MEKIKNIILKEFELFGKTELLIDFLALCVVITVSILKSDSILAILASIFGLLYTILSGKGKIYCYGFGITGTLCCAVVSFQIALYGYALLHLFYYLPMEIAGICAWKKHLKTDSNEIIKTKLTTQGIFILIFVSIVATYLCRLVFMNIHDSSPFNDALILVLSISGMILTVKRCIEQWIVWTIVNIFSVFMWFEMFAQGERTFSIFLVRIVYLFLGLYFFFNWKRSLKTTI